VALVIENNEYTTLEHLSTQCMHSKMGLLVVTSNYQHTGSTKTIEDGSWKCMGVTLGQALNAITIGNWKSSPPST